MKENSVETYRCQIYMAGDISQAKQACREYCMKVGLCVTVTPTDFIYTGGEETGFVVGLINYPRFPASPVDINTTAGELAELLREKLCQHSYTVVSDQGTYWHTTREERC